MPSKLVYLRPTTVTVFYQLLACPVSGIHGIDTKPQCRQIIYHGTDICAEFGAKRLYAAAALRRLEESITILL